MFSQPSVQQSLVPHSIERRHDYVRSRHFVRFHFDLRHFGGPWHPFACYTDLEDEFSYCIFAVHPRPPYIILHDIH